MMDLPPLSAEQFPAFFRGVQLWTGAGWDAGRHAFDPFPWQTRLAREVASRGRWPVLLDLPTGSGKTAAIDVAVFHLALEADRRATRAAAMRVAFVVDRRLVVDDAYLRAKRLAAALKDALDSIDAPDVVRNVARRLRHLAGDDQPPLIARSMRGGAPREDDWARTPCQPTVLCSTVDQVGSRLLFRGYGVSDSMKPVQAGLLGSDALILLDEAHLSQPFRQTAQAIAEVRAIRGSDSAPFHTALLTATPGEDRSDGEWRFRLDREDHEHEILARRLAASKPTKLVEVAASEDARVEKLASQALEMIETLQADGVATPVVGVIANRVARARAAFVRLRQELGDAADLVIGRARAVDREDVAARLAPIRTGVARPTDRVRVVVATQTLEAGVDIDLDALVTDAASLDALRQRFGRVNRDGRDIPARGVILADKTDRKPKKDGDPIYGEAIAKTVEALFANGDETVDFGVAALDELLTKQELKGPAIAPLLSDKWDAPVLMPGYVDLWSHTSPRPSVDPEPALFLHGPHREPASVQLVWRADLDLGLGDARVRELISLTPPRAAEAIELPVWAVRRWLLGAQGLDLADVDQVEIAESQATSPKGAVFRWRGADDDQSRIIRAAEVVPGDVIVVPSSYGGCDDYGWSPGGDAPVSDVYEKASAPYDGRRYVVRIAPGLIRQTMLAEAEKEAEKEDSSETREAPWERLGAKAERIANDVSAALADPSARAPAVVAALLELGLPQSMQDRLEALRQHAHRGRLDPPAYPYGGEDGDRAGVVLVAPFGLKDRRGAADVRTVASTEDDEAGSFTGAVQSLAEHSSEVEAKARAFAERAGLTESLADDLALAGWLHDAGKADLRFQRLLHGGDLLAMEKDAVLAKSRRGRSPPGAWERAGLPRHWRHEALSVRLALDNPRLQEAHDRALVLWLVGVHHGHGRPFFPHEDHLDAIARELAAVDDLCRGSIDAGPGPQSLAFIVPEDERFGPREGRRSEEDDLCGLDWATLFRDLKRRYGPWGLARLEATLRLADHRASDAAVERARA